MKFNRSLMFRTLLVSMIFLAGMMQSLADAVSDTEEITDIAARDLDRPDLGVGARDVRTIGDAVSLLKGLGRTVPSRESESSVKVKKRDTGPVPLHELLSDPTDLGFSLSPDGNVLARQIWTPSVNILSIHDTESGEVTAEIPLGRARIHGISWLSPRRMLFEAYGKVVALNIDGTDSQILLDKFEKDKSTTIYGYTVGLAKDSRTWEVKDLMPDDPDNILVQSRNHKDVPSIVKVNIFTGEQTVVVSEPKLAIDNWLVDRKGEVRFGLRYRKDRAEILAKDPGSGRWTVYDDYEADVENTLGFSGKTYLTRRINFEEFDYDSNKIFMSINRDSDRYRLVRYDIARRQVVEDVYASEKYDVGGPDADWASLLFLESEQKLIGILLAEDKLKTVWFDDRFQSYQDTLDEFRPDTVNRIFDWSHDGRVLLVSSYSDVDRGRYSIFRPDLKRIINFSEVNENLRSAKLSATKVINFAARDGYDLEGYLNLPVDHSGEPGKLVVLPHGGPWARDHWRFDPWVQYFATRGYAVLRVNFRGSTGYGREHLLAGLKKIDSVMIDDIADGVNWTASNGYARPDAVYIFGHSYGGYAALMSTVRHPELYAAAVAWSAPLDLMEQIKAYKEKDDYFSYEFWKTAVGDPKREKDVLKRISPIYNVDKMSVPILVFHGETDEIVSSKQAQEFEKALRRTNNDTEVLIVKDEGHTFSSNSNISYVLERTLRFFDKNQPR